MPDNTETNENIREDAREEVVEASEAAGVQKDAVDAGAQEAQEALEAQEAQEAQQAREDFETQKAQEAQEARESLNASQAASHNPYGQASDLVLDKVPQPSGTAPLVLGILSIVFAGIIGLVLGIIGVMKSNDVLKVAPENGKAKGGRICSIIGIVCSVVAFVAAVIMIGFLGFGFSVFGGEISKVNDVANQKLAELTNPSEAERAEIATNLDTAFASGAGISLTDLGVSSADFSNWLFEGTSYSIVDTDLKTENGKDTATVKANVTAHSIMDMSKVLEQKVNAIDVSKLTTTEEYLAIIGQAVTQSMKDTPAATKSVTFTLTKVDGKWQVDAGADQRIAEQIYAS